MKKFLPYACVIVCLVSVILWQIFSKDKSYYLISVAVLLCSMLPFFITFEGSRTDAKEIALIASLISIAVVSRAVFYLVPQVKPIGAVVIVSGICLGSKRGYLVGAFSAFISNFIFGQGIWTPFQMVALGLVGFLSGLIFSRVKANKINLALVGFVLTFALYGFIVDLSTVLMLSNSFSLSSALAVYGAGLPFSLAFGLTTSIFLVLFGEAFIKKINRIKTKYGVCEVAYE